MMMMMMMIMMMMIITEINKRGLSSSPMDDG